MTHDPSTAAVPARFDLCVIGAGPAGFAAATRAHDLGRTVLLIERDTAGGRGLRAGALSSKTLWHLSNDYARACRTDRGFAARDIKVSFNEVMDEVRQALDERRAQLDQQLEHLARPSARGGRIVRRHGAARFLTPHAVEVTLADGARERFEADHFLIATGSVPRVPPGVEVDGDRVMTSDHIESLRDFPESMVVVGAGVVGCEYATVFANFRRTRVNIIDRQPRILPFEDDDVAQVVSRNFERMGILIHRESSLESLRVVDGKVEYVVCSPDGVCAPIRVERALVSIGRVPNTRGLGLAEIGVALDKNGAVVCNGTRSSLPHIYAAGDVTADVALVNIAELEGRHAAEEMFDEPRRLIRYDALSAIYFLSPEVASVGLNEIGARKKGIAHRVGVVHNRLVSRNIAMRATDGFIKLLVARDAPGKLLGMRVVGPQAATAIQGIAMLMEKEGTLEDIDACVHPHPAVTEGVQECARALLGRSVLKPEVFGKDLLRVDEWTGDELSRSIAPPPG